MGIYQTLPPPHATLSLEAKLFSALNRLSAAKYLGIPSLWERSTSLTTKLQRDRQCNKRYRLEYPLVKRRVI